MKTYELLKSFAETPGPSGFETRISDLVRETWQPFVDDIDVDRVGNLVGLKKGAGSDPKPKILLAAHMDEIGLMVTKMEAYPDTGGGFLRATSVGGVDRRQLYGQRVVVHGSKNEQRDLPGVLGSLPSWMLPNDRGEKTQDYLDLVVDLGLSLSEIEETVSVGDFISFQQPVRKLLNKRVTGKALDNRVSVVVLSKCLEMLRKRSHQWDVIAVATAQEETVLLGAFTSAYDQQPDVAIAVDVTFAKGPGVTEDFSYGLGDGPAIGIGPNVHPGIFQALQDAADRIEVDVHIEPHSRMSGTDLVGLQIARQGIPTGLVSIPIRNMHTSSEIVSLVDINRASRLIVEFITNLDDTFLSALAAQLMSDDKEN
jgi:putative aminopeptidase FrvX